MAWSLGRFQRPICSRRHLYSMSGSSELQLEFGVLITGYRRSSIRIRLEQVWFQLEIKTAELG